MSILSTIVEHKKMEIESSKELISVSQLEKMAYFDRDTYKLTDSLTSSGKTGIIAEFKRKSPSKGIINDTSKVADVTSGYANHGASALSILTDSVFFGGSVDDLKKVRKLHTIPILRKEFIVDEYQVYETKAIGADAILLIASILDKNQATSLAKKAHDLGLEVLMEIHEEEELKILNEDLDVVGINNRNLKTFKVDIHHSIKLGKKISDEFVKISESGISSASDVINLKNHGFSGFLIGENFMKTYDPVNSFANFAQAIRNAQGK